MLKNIFLLLTLMLYLTPTAIFAESTAQLTEHRQSKSIITSQLIKDRNKEKEEKTLRTINSRTKSSDDEEEKADSAALNMMMNSLFNPFALRQQRPNY